MQGPVVSHNEWLQARKQFLAREKELTRLRDALARERQALPRERVEKHYIFEYSEGKRCLEELFDGSGQLIVYHFMMGPEWPEGCPSCSFLVDQFDAMRPHLLARDVNLVAVSRAPWREIAAFKSRMGWKFPWYSSFGTDFNRDFGASFTKDEFESGKMQYNYTVQEFPSEEAPGASVFAKSDAGELFHTYSTYGRGLDMMLNAYNFIDLTPKGRNEEGLPWPMAWVRHHDKYESAAAHACCGSHQQTAVSR
jgi:predicted dithiol-disulfide oxidoreductase (DUF899 family)